MTISVNFNPSVLKTQRNLNDATDALNNALERMSTGFKVNCASDDSAGLYVATKLNTQIMGLNQAKKNANDGISFLHTAGGSLKNMTNILNRLHDLAVQGANGVYSDEARATMQMEVAALTKQLYQIKNGTLFNGMSIFGDEETSPFSVFSAFSSDYLKADSEGFINAISKMSEAAAIAAGYTVIKTATDLNNIRNNLSGKYMLMSDIDLSGYTNWDPIGEQSNSFRGTFDGNGYKVKNLKIDRASEDYVGLFGYTVGAKIQNVGLENIDIKGKSFTGGLIGYNLSSSIINSYVSGHVTGFMKIGGLVGWNANNSSITNSYSSANVSGQDGIGGLVGLNYEASTITNSYATGSITGTELVGGLAGSNEVGSIITNSYATGNISGQYYVGGLVGQNSMSDLRNSYATGSVTGIKIVGGLAGANSSFSIISNCYASGAVSGTERAGGLLGSNMEQVTDSFWDIEKTGQTIGVSTNSEKDPTKFFITGLTSSQMIDSKNFTDSGWTTADWSFYDGYAPKLAWESTPPPAPPPPEKGNIRLQIGANEDENSMITFNAKFRLGNFKLDLTSTDSCIASIEDIDEQLERISSKNSEFGAILNRLDSILQSQTIQIENLSASRSSIMDADIAEESAIFVRNQILQQTSGTLLVQSQSLQKQTTLRLLN